MKLVRKMPEIWGKWHVVFFGAYSNVSLLQRQCGFGESFLGVKVKLKIKFHLSSLHCNESTPSMGSSNDAKSKPIQFESFWTSALTHITHHHPTTHTKRKLIFQETKKEVWGGSFHFLSFEFSLFSGLSQARPAASSSRRALPWNQQTLKFPHKYLQKQLHPDKLKVKHWWNSPKSTVSAGVCLRFSRATNSLKWRYSSCW